MHVIIKKWGNSPAVRIPAGVMAAAKLTVDATVNVREESGRIIIEPVQFDELQALLDGITPENLHREVDFGEPVGLEAF